MSTANPIGSVAQGEGKVFSNAHATVVRKHFSPSRKMGRHNHPGAQIVFTVVSGHAHVLLEDKEQHELKSGDVLIFHGDHHISAEFSEETQLVITLIPTT